MAKTYTKNSDGSITRCPIHKARMTIKRSNQKNRFASHTKYGPSKIYRPPESPEENREQFKSRIKAMNRANQFLAGRVAY